ncbi:MAG: DNA replication/repair protein RecF [Actinobacteria bacterium]|nr:DNA replication/repair protein RecF [Actinomycetota bacterium]
MHVSSLSLTDFRSWPTLELELGPGSTALVGANGQGKTNLVEAIGYVATLGSHRVAADAPLVRAGCERAVVRVRVERDGRATLVELELNPGRANRARVNRGPLPRAREVLGILRAVLFAPEDLSLVRGDPSERRRFLDDLLVASAPRYAGVRADYERVLKQRNALLRTSSPARRHAAATAGGGDMRTLDVWDAHLARCGAELISARLALVAALRPQVADAYRAVAAADERGRSGTEVDYRSSLGESMPTDSGEPARDRDLLAAAMLSELARVRASELDRGVSLVGPHRDELVLGLSGLPVKGYASHGESWSVALALRLASYELLKVDGGEPVLLLDDVFAELDEGRRDRLAGIVAGAEQVIVTAAVPADVPEALAGSRYDVHGGSVTRVR